MAAVKNRRPRGVIQINQNCSIEISKAHPNRFELLTDNNVKVFSPRLFLINNLPPFLCVYLYVTLTHFYKPQIFAQTDTEKEAQVWVQHIAAVINACKAEIKRQTDALGAVRNYFKAV